MSTQKITCIRCPMGCEITAEIENNEIKSISGNSCKLGIEHAKKEITAPERIVTSTVVVNGGRNPLVSVWTEKAVPKEKIMELADLLRTISISAPVQIGDVVFENALGLGVNILASSNVDKT